MKRKLLSIAILAIVTVCFSEKAMAQSAKYKKMHYDDSVRLAMTILEYQLAIETQKTNYLEQIQKLQKQVRELQDDLEVKQSTNMRMFERLDSIKVNLKTGGFTTSTGEISDLVQDSTAAFLVKNMELGLKFYQMLPEELAARYSGLSVNWRRDNKNKFLLGRSFVDVSTDALQGEILKWMKYLYDNSKSAERIRYSNLFYNITGDEHFKRKNY